MIKIPRKGTKAKQNLGEEIKNTSSSPKVNKEDLDIDEVEDHLDTAISQLSEQRKVKLKFNKPISPDDLFSVLEDFYTLPISYVREDYEHNPRNKEDINKLPEDILKFFRRFKRDKGDMDLFYKLGLKYAKGAFTRGDN